MELFIVNRYVPGSTNETSNEDKLKQNLLNKVNERKRKRDILRDAGNDKTPDLKTRQTDENENKDSLKKPMRKKKKKKKENLVEKELPVKESVPSNYLILGEDKHGRREITKRVLPHWLKNASVVSVDLQNLTYTVDSIPMLDLDLLESLKNNGITHFFPVQAQVIPWLIGTMHWPSMYWPSDVCVSAPTGSGKTLAFVLPIIQALKPRLTSQIRAMIVLPVQDLAKQVFKVFQTYVASTTLKVMLLSNAINFHDEQKQIVKKDKLTGHRCLVDIIVTTPGRLVDHIKTTEGFSLSELQYLVIDEADRVMEGIQNDWLYHVNTHIGLHSGTSKSFQLPPLCLRTLTSEKRPPQKLLFSATLSQDPEKLQQLGLFQPKLFTSVVGSDRPAEDEVKEDDREFVGKFTTPAELKETFVQCTASSKPMVIIHLLREQGWRHVLCFTRSRETARRLAALLKALGSGWIKVSEITANLAATKRNRRLHKFATGKLDVLVCSDALARGIDIPNVQCVISYDMPKYIKNHVHRVGRTGRAGHEGTAVTLILPKEMTRFKEIMQTGRKSKIEEIIVSDETLQELIPRYQAALGVLKKKLEISTALHKAKVRRWKTPKRRNVLLKKAVKDQTSVNEA